MHRLRCLSLLGLVAASVFAAAPPARTDGREVARLILQLRDRDFARRDAAQRQLATMGPSILPALAKAAADPDPEVRRRAMRLIGPLERERDFRPKSVTATFRNAPLEKVLAELGTQAGFRIQFMPEDPTLKPRFTGSFRDVTFWEAIDRVAADCNLVPTEAFDDKGRPGLGLMPAKRPNRFVSREGAFRLAVHRIDQSRSLDLDDDEGNDEPPSIGLTLSVRGEPRFEFVDIGEPRVESATDDRGRSLLSVIRQVPPTEEVVQVGALERGVGGGSGTMSVNFNVALSRHFADSARIRAVKGVLPARVIVGRTTRVLLEKLTKGQTFDYGPMKVELEQVKAQKKRLEVRLKVKPPGGMMMDDPIPDGDLARDLEFRDDDGNVCKHMMQEQAAEGVFVLRVSPVRRNGKPPSKLLLKEPIVKSVEIRFEFRDLPLP